MNTLEETVTHALANAITNYPERDPLSLGEWRATILVATFGWLGRKLIGAAGRGFRDFGAGMPVFDAHRHRGPAWN